MYNSMLEEKWIIWNSSLGIRDFVMIDRIEVDSSDRVGWLEEPYDMVGPFSLDALKIDGQIHFAACTVMSRTRWHKDQVKLRQESYAKRYVAQEELYEELSKYNKRKQSASYSQQFGEKEHRKLLCLPSEGELNIVQIKVAYKKLVKTAHPDVGGSHELFIQITEARNALLECLA